MKVDGKFTLKSVGVCVAKFVKRRLLLNEKRAFAVLTFKVSLLVLQSDYDRSICPGYKVLIARLFDEEENWGAVWSVLIIFK